MWQGPDGAREKRFTLWLLLSPPVDSTHICTQTTLSLPGLLHWLSSASWCQSFFLAHCCWAWLCAYQPMSSRYPTRITLLCCREVSKKHSYMTYTPQGGRDEIGVAHIQWKVCFFESRELVKKKRSRQWCWVFVLEELNMSTDGGQRRDGLLLLNITVWNTGSDPVSQLCFEKMLFDILRLIQNAYWLYFFFFFKKLPPFFIFSKFWCRIISGRIFLVEDYSW